ncbi:MAG: GH3 auxin-responsive promoter family protein [Candidatus Omnitrophica bacterium]|nr:GH3 auxin-responsive promoter family protein [Candidatus Omnitrophota bacterium]
MKKSILKKLLVAAAILRGYRTMDKFLEATKNPRETQGRALLRKLRLNGDSRWGRENNFRSIHSADEFRKRLPLADYETFQPYIEDLKRGKTNSLLGRREKLLGLGLTSGTTGNSKFIPFTRSFVREYKEGALLFTHRMATDYPQAMEGKILSVFSPAREYKTDGGIWCGSVSGWIAEHQATIVRSFYALPGEVSDIKDVHARYYTLMRLSIPINIGSIVTANPSTVITLAKLANDEKENLIRDIRDGTLKVKELVPKSILKIIKPYLRPNPALASRLDDLAKRSPIFTPADYWPGLALVACWKGGTLFSYVNQFPRYFGKNTAIRDIGLLATEGRLSIPVISRNDDGALAIDSVFFEFIPEGDESTKTPRTLFAHEVEAGKNYFLVITTSSGFTRYRINDLVKVTGFINKTPLIHFLNKGKHISSITGEKISEHQVVTAVHEASNVMNLHLSHFTMCPCWGEVPYYALLAEENELGDRRRWSELVGLIDERLQKLNLEYYSKRKSGRLGRIQLKVLGNKFFETMKHERARLGGRLEQYKHVYLSPAMDYDKDLPVVETIN